MKNFVAKGDTMNVTNNPMGRTAGDPYLGNGVFGVVAHDIEPGAVGVVNLTGVYKFPKGSGVIGQGATVYWDAAADQITTTSTGNTLVGMAYNQAALNDTTVDVRLNGSKIP